MLEDLSIKDGTLAVKVEKHKTSADIIPALADAVTKVTK